MGSGIRKDKILRLKDQYRDVRLSEIPINPAFALIPNPSARLGKGSQKWFNLPSLPDLREEGWGGEGKIVAHRVKDENPIL